VNGKRFFRIADISIQVEADIPITEKTFATIFDAFRVDEPGQDVITIRHHFGLPELTAEQRGKKIGDKMYLTIYQSKDGWIYDSTGFDERSEPVRQLSFVNPEHTRIDVYTERDDVFKDGTLYTLSFYPHDMFFLSRILADRRGCMFHSSGVILDGQGLLFVGHSGAGKSSMVKMLQRHAKILCDDRNIVRQGDEGFRIFGTWNHGEVPIVSSRSAPLRSILFLQKAAGNRILPLDDRLEAIRQLVACTIKPMTTAEWWGKTFLFIEGLVNAVPCRVVEFDLSGGIVDLLNPDGLSVR
jgi:hypothetical protein